MRSGCRRNGAGFIRARMKRIIFRRSRSAEHSVPKSTTSIARVHPHAALYAARAVSRA